jgi:signal transduction histidine kinase
MDALTRIRSNGKHLLGLINTVLDIAKIESGQFTLNMAEFAMESVVETVALRHQVPRPEQEARAQDRGGQVATPWPRRRAAHWPLQREQVRAQRLY